MEQIMLTYEQWLEKLEKLIAEYQVLGVMEDPYMIEMSNYGISNVHREYPKHSARYKAE